MTTLTDLGKRIFGSDRGFAKQAVGSRSKTSDVRHGTALSETVDGWVSVQLDGSDEAVDLECDVPVAEGQRVSVAIDSGVYKVISVGQVVVMAEDAATAAEEAQAAADEAKKTATNYLDFDDGLIIGDMTDETLGNNVRIDSDSVDIRNGETELASFAGDVISIGANSPGAMVNLCGGMGTIKATDVLGTGKYYDISMRGRAGAFLTTFDDSARIGVMPRNAAGGLNDPQVTVYADAFTYNGKQVATVEDFDASNQIAAHNVATDSHNDVRLLIQGLTDRLNALANSDDATLDQMSEIVAYIKANRGLIESVTTAKVNVSDIIDNLTTNVGDRPLSAAQGVALKQLIAAIKVPANVSAFANDAGYLTEVPSEYLTESQLFGVEAANMPQGFTQLQYIESTGQQFVNTEYYPSGGKLRVVLKFMYVREHNGLSLFGSSSGAPFSMTVYGYYPTFYVGESSNIFCGEESSLNTLYTLDATADNGTLTAVWNGVAFTKAYSGNLRTSSPFYVFGAGAYTELGNGYRLYSMKIYDSDELVRDFFPCMNASGEYGLYDDKNAVFYRNNGGGEFVGGPAVSISVPIERGGTGATDADTARANIGAAAAEHTHDQYLTEHQSLDGYATQTWVEGKNYLTQHQSLADYAKKTDIPTVPTKVSAFTNDAGYLTAHQDLSAYAKKSELPTVPSNVSAFANDAGYLAATNGNLSIPGTYFGNSLGTDTNRFFQFFGTEYYFANANASYDSPYKFGMYQWNDNFTFVTRNASNSYLMDAWQINGATGVTNFWARPTLNGDGLVSYSDLSGYAPKYTYGTEDLTAGSSALATGTLYFVYE